MKNHTPYEVVEHNWSDTSVIDANGNTVLTVSIYDEATEETQEQLEEEMSDKINFIVKACNNHDRLVDLLYEANNQARKMLNRHDPNNINEMEKVNSRAKYLAENFGNNNEPKIIQSNNC